jgi:hypothetical protein
MKLIQTLLVRDEEDIIRENIAYHLNRGVDRLIVTDNNSKDGTIDILKDYEKQGVLDIIFEEEDNYSQWKWVTRMAAIAIDKHKADWVINSDADEFWWPAEGNLKDALAAVPGEYAVLEVPRNDFVPRPESEGTMFERMIIKNLKSLNHIGKPLPPKICHRAIPGVIIAQGNHKLIYPTDLMVFRNPVLEIMHFPMRSYAQFENKIAYGGAAVERNDSLPKTMLKGWRNLYEDYRKGNLSHYYYSKILPFDDLSQAIIDGHYCRDTRLRDFLKERNIIN